MAWRLLWRQQRWELTILIGGSLFLAAALFIVAWQLQVTQESLVACYTEQAFSPACRSLVDIGNVWTALAPIGIGVATVAPFLVGLFLGAPLVSREIEKRTAPMAWSLSLSRRDWLLSRVLPLTVVVAIVLLLVGQGSEMLHAAAYPDQGGFWGYGSRGPLIAARGLAIFGIGVVVGLVSGRMLPAILVTGLVAIAVFGGVEYARSQLLRAEATWIEVDQETNGFSEIAMIYDSGFVDDATGETITSQQAFERFPDEFGPTGDGIPPGMTMTYLTTPPERYPFFVARESAVLIGVFALAGGLALLMIHTRRPL
ncbi:MAG TPA: hypothetical protein VFN76_11875 [Candidatus Limnocylindria bacterium]|nr:hypothetical protein [Candidatus Limnocylindria bacterium]